MKVNNFNARTCLKHSINIRKIIFEPSSGIKGKRLNTNKKILILYKISKYIRGCVLFKNINKTNKKRFKSGPEKYMYNL